MSSEFGLNKVEVEEEALTTEASSTSHKIEGDEAPPPEEPIPPQKRVKIEKEGEKLTAPETDGDDNTKGKRRVLNVAVAGCSHGELDLIYGRLEEEEHRRGIKIDLLICCGDFQANRNYGDLHYFHSPPWHRKLKTFYKYYSGFKIAPVLTIFVGGNHESPAFLAELPNGGWVAPNIYYMGFASVLNFGGLRIAGISGIFKPKDYNKGHYERPPFVGGTHVSAYHVRSTEVFRLQQLSKSINQRPVDIFLTHDWPAGITDFGDSERLLQIKPHFANDIAANKLGNPATMDLLWALKPRFWFAAHMHVKFEAVVEHNKSEATDSSMTNNNAASTTKFLALDKPAFHKQTGQLDQRRRFLEILEIPIPSTDDDNQPPTLSYDPEWLAILKATDFLTAPTDRVVYMPSSSAAFHSQNPGEESSQKQEPEEEASHKRLFEALPPSKEALEEILRSFGGSLEVPQNFQQTAPPQVYSRDGGGGGHQQDAGRKVPPSLYYRNPQSTVFYQRLGITDLNELFAVGAAADGCLGIPHYYYALENEKKEGLGGETSAEAPTKNPEEIDIGDDDDDEFGGCPFVVDE